MRRKEALYAVIGGVVGAILTMVVGSFSPLGAQSQSDGNFEMVFCKALVVKGTDGGHKVWISSEEKTGHGFILVMGKDVTEDGGAESGVSEDGGFVHVRGFRDGQFAAVTLDPSGVRAR